MRRKALVSKIMAILTKEHRTFAEAGNCDGKRFTPFQATCMKVAATVKASPGIILKDLIESVDTHYTSTSIARTSILKWTQQGIIKGIHIEYEDEGKTIRFYPNG
ncbi:MAG: hypothetical protein AB1401_00875 [Thermodesulfobacteriota bacterium]